MTPADIGRSYDAITHQWDEPKYPLPGLAQHERALQFLQTRRDALDVGCGCSGRLVDFLKAEGFRVEGIDVSEQMIALAKRRDPDVTFHHADICDWELPRQYDFISGWDSIWHVPLAEQESVFRKLCGGLNPGGVFIFTMGGTDGPNEMRDSHMGVPMYTATLGIPGMLEVLGGCRCVCRHLEFDQQPQLHVYVIAQKA